MSAMKCPVCGIHQELLHLSAENHNVLGVTVCISTYMCMVCGNKFVRCEDE